jgi:hypothetical protein
MAAKTIIGKGLIVGFGTGNVAHGSVVGAVAGTVLMNVQNLRTKQSADVSQVKDQNGEIVAKISSGVFYEVDIDFIPEGTTIANAVSAAAFPALLAAVTLSAFPVIVSGDGTITDLLNSALWVYEGGGQISGVSDKNWSCTMTIRRYPGITTLTPIVA